MQFCGTSTMMLDSQQLQTLCWMQLTRRGDQIAIASITLAEIVYLVEKGRIDNLAFERVVQTIEQVNATLVEIPFSRTIAEAMRQIGRTQVPELPDRIVTATAFYLGVPVISRDHKIRSSLIPTIW